MERFLFLSQLEDLVMTNNHRSTLLAASFFFGLCLVLAAPMVPGAFAVGVINGVMAVILVIVLTFGAWLFAVMAQQ